MEKVRQPLKEERILGQSGNWVYIMQINKSILLLYCNKLFNLFLFIVKTKKGILKCCNYKTKRCRKFQLIIITAEKLLKNPQKNKLINTVKVICKKVM